jgi:ankyrin repeat protein
MYSKSELLICVCENALSHDGLPKRLINTLFLIACQCACVELVEILLKRNADPHWVNDSGANDLHFACYKDSLSLPIAEILLSLRVSANVPEKLYGCTPLHYAASAGNLALCRLLIECGAYIHAHDYDGCDSIAYARDAGMSEVTEYHLTQALALSQRPQGRNANLSTAATTHATAIAAAKAAAKSAVSLENVSLPPTPGSAVTKSSGKTRMIINTSASSYHSTDDEDDVEGGNSAHGSTASATPTRHSAQTNNAHASG